MTLDQLAELVGTTNQQVSHLEMGKRRLTVDWMMRLAEALDCHPWALVSEDFPAVLTRREDKLMALFREASFEKQEEAFELLERVQSKLKRRK